MNQSTQHNFMLKSFMVKKVPLLSSLAGLLILLLIAATSQLPQSTTSYILQGATQPTMISAVDSVGGTVTHQFKAIDAITAELSSSQVSRLSLNKPLIRLFKDSGVKISNATPDYAATGKNHFDYDGKPDTVSWKIRNNGNHDLTISSVSISWPYENAQLVKLAINGKKIYNTSLQAPQATVLSGWTHDPVLKAGYSNDFRMQFTAPPIQDDGQYTVIISTEQGTTIEFLPGGQLPAQHKNRDSFFPSTVKANSLHQQGITGSGITVAVIDSGLMNINQLRHDTLGNSRIKANFVATADSVFAVNKLEDNHGHGTHVTSILANNSQTYNSHGQFTGSYNGIAPDVSLVSVQAFDQHGQSNYSTVLNALDFIIANKDTYGIDVLNLSFSANAITHYWNDPINRAVMRAWEAGIVVVASAGNKGPHAKTIGVPGNNPYVITVGAITDNYTPNDTTDDMVTQFSSAGPTYEGFVKPELVAPGGHIMGFMDKSATIPSQHPQFHDGYKYFVMSGTSQATAVVSG
ncbi:MAG: S8 family peptidase, partial [Psychrosphaera sp.]|nr:S8 family peptidase [Psychrosphaera sp.]